MRMPNAAPDRRTTYKLRLGTAELAAWKKAAEKAGVKLAEWMRRELNDVASGTVVVLQVPVSLTVEKPMATCRLTGIAVPSDGRK